MNRFRKASRRIRFATIVGLASIIGCGPPGGGGANNGDVVISANENAASKVATTDSAGRVSITLDSGDQGVFEVRNQSGQPLEGIEIYIYKDNKGATIGWKVSRVPFTGHIALLLWRKAR